MKTIAGISFSWLITGRDKLHNFQVAGEQQRTEQSHETYNLAASDLNKCEIDTNIFRPMFNLYQNFDKIVHCIILRNAALPTKILLL